MEKIELKPKERKLTLRELAPYLPYNLQIEFKRNIYPRSVDIKTLNSNAIGIWDGKRFEIKPVLRPLSDIIKTIHHNGEVFRPIIRLLQASCFDTDKMQEADILSYVEPCYDPYLISFKDAQLLFEWHFDVFNLIPDGLAIDINNLTV